MRHDIDFADLYFQYQRPRPGAWKRASSSRAASTSSRVWACARSAAKDRLRLPDDISLDAPGRRRHRHAFRSLRLASAAASASSRTSSRPAVRPTTRSTRSTTPPGRAARAPRGFARGRGSARHPGHGAHRRHLGGGDGGAQRRPQAADVRPLVRVSITVIMEGTAARAGQCRRRRALRLRLVLRRPPAGLRPPGGASGAQNLGADPAPAAPCRWCWANWLAGHPAPRGDRPRPGGDFKRKGSSAFRAHRPAGRGQRRHRWMTARCPTAAARCRSTTRATRPAAHRADRGQHPHRLHAGHDERRLMGMRADRQRPPRVLRPPAAAHDQHPC